MTSYSVLSQWSVARFFTAVAPVSAALLVALTAGKAEAQVNFAIEGRASVTAPVGDLSDSGAGTGIGLGADVYMNFHPKMSVYGGLHQFSFSCEDNCSLGNNPKSTGLHLGLKYFLHNPGDVLVWGRGGIVASSLENDQSSNDREIGFELGFGADMPIATQLYLVPHVGFVSHNAGGDFNASFMSLGVGVHYHF